MDLNEIYEYKEQYFKNRIYYLDQTSWGSYEYGRLNAELNKLFLIGIEYHFSPDDLSREKESCRLFDMEIGSIKFERLSEQTKCIMVAILNQQKVMNKFLRIYTNLSSLSTQKPLKEKLYLSSNPYNIFPSYKSMNIEY